MAVGESWEDYEMDTGRSSWNHRNRGCAAAHSERFERSLMWRVFHRLDAVLERLSWLPSLVLLIALIIVIVQLADRRPPFKLLHADHASAHAGEAVVFRADVWRDPSRRCSVTMSRSLFDGAGARWDYPISNFSQDLIARMERDTPGEMRAAIVVPPGAMPGDSELVSVLSYRCNRVHALAPIEVTTHIPFTILP